MKVHEYNEMMAYMLRPRQKFAIGGGVVEGKDLGSREGFSKLYGTNIRLSTTGANTFEVTLNRGGKNYYQNFKFDFKGVQTSDECITLNCFYDETDWIFKGDRTFNFFYPLDVDKADFIGRDVYRDNNANVNINPFQSNFGASNIVSYSPPDPNRQKSESEKMFERKRAFVSPQKQINSAAFKGMGYTRGR